MSKAKLEKFLQACFPPVLYLPGKPVNHIYFGAFINMIRFNFIQILGLFQGFVSLQCVTTLESIVSSMHGGCSVLKHMHALGLSFHFGDFRIFLFQMRKAKSC